MTAFKLTPKQQEANILLGGNETHCMLFGGSRSGKTFLLVRAVIFRALKYHKSRHAILRFRFNHVKSSIIFDTFPKVMELCFPDVEYHLNKTDWFVSLPGGSEIWFGGLDDKDRVEKILGQEYLTIYLNECSQISWSARNMAVTRLAQNIKGAKLKFYYDCNPPPQTHWTYKLFQKRMNPGTNQTLANVGNFTSLLMNPTDNADNLSQSYLDELEGLSESMKARFLYGVFRSADENALWSDDTFAKWRVLDGSNLPDFQRVVVAVDPSGADDDTETADAIGIMVVGLGTDGVAYVSEDLTLTAGPAKWGKVVSSAYNRHAADRVVGESNYGGAMVEFVVRAADPDISYKAVTASRGKVIRAEPVSALYEAGKVRHIGTFPDLEAELSGFTTTGYIGESSPNRADALVWAITELFPSLTKKTKSANMDKINKALADAMSSSSGWSG